MEEREGQERGTRGGKGIEERKGERGGGEERRGVLDLPLKYMVTTERRVLISVDWRGRGGFEDLNYQFPP